MIEEILGRVRRREKVRHTLSAGGVLSLDRGLPYLLVHREGPGDEDAGTARLISGEASYLISRAGEEDEVSLLVRRLAKAGSSVYGAFLVLEIWSSADAGSRRFTIKAPRGPAPETVGRLTEALQALVELLPGVEVSVATDDERHPPGLQPLLSIAESWKTEVLLLGLEVPPVYRDPESGDLDPRFLRLVQRGLSHALRQAIYEFVRVQTTCKVENHLALGTRVLPEAVWEVDRALSVIERSFDLLLLTPPVNGEEAWAAFQEDDFQANPDFHYRLLPLDPDLVKRRLFAIEMETIDDPAIADLYQDKREELDTQLTMLRERGSARFRYSSYRLYGTVSDPLRDAARELLAAVPLPVRRSGERIDALGFRRAAAEEMAYYAARYPEMVCRIDIRRDLTGLMVSEGKLLIGEGLSLDPRRVPALLQHEVGTHVLTYANGRAQLLGQLAQGLAGYDELQEGLAVLSEYLVGGLDRLRARLLAARVLAARSVEEGGEFVDTFRMLTHDYGYSPRGAWHIAIRVHACGGFTRDLIYLRGLVKLLEWLRNGGGLRSLYVGKIAQKHIPIVEELRHREVLREPPLTPRFFDYAETEPRLEAVRRGITLTEMICPENE